MNVEENNNNLEELYRLLVTDNNSEDLKIFFGIIHQYKLNSLHTYNMNNKKELIDIINFLVKYVECGNKTNINLRRILELRKLYCNALLLNDVIDDKFNDVKKKVYKMAYQLDFPSVTNNMEGKK